jgi:hypothetical protein
MEADKDGDGKLDFDEFAMMVSNTVRLLHFVFRGFSMKRKRACLLYKENEERVRSKSCFSLHASFYRIV